MIALLIVLALILTVTTAYRCNRLSVATRALENTLPVPSGMFVSTWEI